MSDFNLIQWEQFVNHGIEDMLDSYAYADKDMRITYSLEKKEQLLADTISLSSLLNNKSTYTKDLYVKINIEMSDGSSFEVTENILTIPGFIDQGFVYNGNIYEIVSTYSKLTGFNLDVKKKASTYTDSAKLRHKVYVYNNELNVNTSRGDIIKFSKVKNKLVVTIMNPYAKDPSKDKRVIDLGIFLSALTGKSVSDVINLVGDTPMLRESISSSIMISAEDALTRLCDELDGSYCYTPAEKRHHIRVKLSPAIYTLKNNIRFENQMKFTQRCKGMVLAEDLTLDGNVYKAGLVLNESILKSIDDCKIRTLNVTDNSNNIYKVVKYADSFEEKILTAVNWFILSFYGFEYETNKHTVDNLEINTIDKLFCKDIGHFFNSLNMELVKEAKQMGLNAITRSIKNCYKKHPKDKLVYSLKSKKYFQQSDCTNILYKISRSYKATSSEGNTDRWSAEKRDLTPQEYGKFCPLDSPESLAIGVNKSITYLAKVDRDGIIRTPYVNTKTGEIEYLSANDEKGKVLGTFDYDETKEVNSARVNGEFTNVPTGEIEYHEISPAQVFSYAAMQVPFIENDSSKRTQMFINQGKAALPPILNEAPLCRTGMESIDFGIYTVNSILAEVKRYKPEIKCTKFFIESIIDTNEERIVRFRFDDEERTKHEIMLPININTMAGSLERWKISYKKEYNINEDCIVCYDSNLCLDNVKISRDFLGYNKYHTLNKEMISKLCMGLGKNFKVVIKLERGGTYEDAILVNADTIGNGHLDTLLCNTITAEIKTSGEAVEEFTRNVVGANPKHIMHISPDGLPKIGTKLNVGDYVICRNRSSKEDNGIIKNTSIRIKPGQDGIVLNTSLSTDGTTASVLIGRIHRAEQGDKLTGRHGNKGVIARIVPAKDMPFAEDGTIADIVITPLGIPPRMNIGQVLEGVASWCARQKGETVIFEPFRKNNISDLQALVDEVGYKSVRAYDGITGLPFDRPVNFCIMYILALNHLSDKKINAIGLAGNNINAITCQPQQGVKRGGGQREGEMEVWALESMGADKVLEDFSGLQSDYSYGEKKLKDAAKDNPDNIKVESKNNNAYYLKALSAAIGVGVISNSNGYKFVVLTNQDILALSEHLVNTANDGSLHSTAFSYKTFKGRFDTYGHVELGVNIINPFAMHMLVNSLAYSNGTILKDADIQSIKDKKTYIKVVDGNIYKVANADEGETGILALVNICNNYDLENTVSKAKAKINEIYANRKSDGEPKDLSKQDLKNIEYYETVIQNVENIRSQYNLSSFVVNKWPVIPAGYRPEHLQNVNVNDRNHDIDILYKNLFKQIEIAKSAHELHLPKCTQDVYEAIEEFGIKSGKGKNKRKKNYRTVADIIKGSKHNIFRETFIGKRQKTSTRSVITVNPFLRPDTIRIPYRSVLTMYSFILTEKALRDEDIKGMLPVDTIDIQRQNLEKLIVNVQNKSYLSNYLAKSDIDDFQFKIRTLTEEFIKDKLAPLGRQPTLHRFNLMAHKFILSDCKTIEISPLICSIYNADFDGDQMWVAILLNAETNQQVREKMTIYQNMINPKDGSMTLSMGHDVKAGCYYATMYDKNIEEKEYTKPETPKVLVNTINELENAIEYGSIKYQDFVYYKGHFTTAGRILLNALHPENLDCDSENGEFTMFMDKLVRKGDIGNWVKDYFIASGRDAYSTVDFIYRITQFGFKVSTSAGLSLLYEELTTGNNSEEIIAEAKKDIERIEKQYRLGFISEKIKKELSLKIWHKCKSRVSDSIVYDRNSNLFIYIDSGARGNEGQFNQIFGMIGNVRNAKDEEIETPVLGNYVTGLSVADYYTICYATRKGLVTTALETRVTGEASRQLIYLNTGMRIIEESCGAKPISLPLKYKAGDERFKLLNKHISKDYEHLAELSILLPEDNRITTEVLDLISSNPLFSEVKIDESDEPIILNHKLDKLSKSLIFCRYTPDLNSYGKFIDEDDIKDIERNKISRINIRSTLNCQSKDGICSTCYGLLYDTGKKPPIGYAVGYESSQAMGEVSSQITLKSFHSGTGEGSLNDATAQLKRLINCTYSSGSLVSPYEGVLKHINGDNYKIGQYSIKIPNCKIEDGRYVKEGDVLTKGIVNVKSFYEQTGDILATQLHFLEEYADVYYSSNIDIYARHFEICVKSQTQRVRIIDPKDSDFKVNEITTFGSVYEANLVRSEENKIEYTFVMMGVSEVVQEEDLMLSLSFSDIFRKIEASVASTKFIPARSTIGKIMIGESVTHPKVLDLKIAKKTKQSNTVPVKEKIEKIKQEEEKLNSVIDIEDFSSYETEMTQEEKETSMKKSNAFS